MSVVAAYDIPAAVHRAVLAGTDRIPTPRAQEGEVSTPHTEQRFDCDAYCMAPTGSHHERCPASREAADLREIILDAAIVAEVMHSGGPLRVPVTYLAERADTLDGGQRP